MPQLRQDRLTKEWVFVATEAEDVSLRELVPHPARKIRAQVVASCPFCPDSDQTMPEASRVANAEKLESKIRVLQPGDGARQEKLLREEFVVETRDHSLDSALLPETHYSAVLSILKSRYVEALLDPRARQVVLIKQQSGTQIQLEHAHWRLSVYRTVNANLNSGMRAARQHFGETGKCVFCSVLHDELQSESRIVRASRDFVALECFASPSPFCTAIYPRRHMASFGELSEDELADLAQTLRDVLAKFYFGLNNPDYVCALNSAPAANNYYHWSLNIVPWLPGPADRPAHSRGLHLNPLLPERAAEFLRSVRIKEAIPA